MSARIRLLAVLLAAACAALWPSGSPPAGSSAPLCDANAGPCLSRIGDAALWLDIRPKPVESMKELTFTLILDGADPPAPLHLDLDMPGMKMGLNRVRLEKVGRGVFRGSGIIVRCPSGRKAWRATVTVAGVGRSEFLFHVSR